MSAIKSNRLDNPFYCGDALRSRVAKDAASIDQHFQFVIGVLHLRPNAVLGFELALQAPGQASQARSYQAAADFNLHIAPLWKGRGFR